MARIELSNIGGGGGTTLSLTTTGTSGASTLAGSVLNIPVYQGQLTLTTTGTSGAATLSGDILNIPQYSGGGTPAGSTGEIQYNNAGAFGASANLFWDDTATKLNIGAPSSPTGKLNIRGGGTTSGTVNLRLTDSGNTEIFTVLDNGFTGVGITPIASLSVGGPVSSTQLTLGPNDGGASFHAGASNNFNFASGARYQSGSWVAKATTAGSFTINAGNISFYQASGLTIGGSVPFTHNMRLSAAGGLSLGSSYTSTDPGAGNAIISGSMSVGSSSTSGRFLTRGSNTSGGTNALLVQNSTPSDIYKIENNGKISYWATNTSAGTTGAQTINRPSGTVNFAAGATALVVTNSLCTTSSIVFATVRTDDATAYIKNVVPAAGSFTINLGAAATAETSVGFFIIN